MAVQKTVRYVILGQVGLFFFLIVCIILMPRFLFERDEGGLSNYGTYVKTVVPYSFALGLSGLLNLKAAASMDYPTKASQRLRKVLATLGVGGIIVLLSTYPYKLNTVLADMHIGLSVLLFTFELMAGVWFVRVVVNNKLAIALLGVQVVGFLLILSSTIGFIRILLLAQMLTSLAFGVLMVRAVAGAVRVT